MARPHSSLPRLAGCVRLALRPVQRRRVRCFSATADTRTDGVYRELTAMRTRIPFVEALRKQKEDADRLSLKPQEEDADSLKPQQEDADSLKPQPTDEVQRDLSPKAMADSYHRVVSHVEPLDPTALI
jgi:acyl-coenzyme A thioesterase 9